MRDLISIRDLEKKDVQSYFSQSAKMEKILLTGKQCRLLEGKLIANMFFEASTRTNMSFQAAAKRLGAKVMTFYPSQSSGAKGESFSDTIRVMDGYADALVIRHPTEGSAQIAADLAEHPVINAGDGANQHPTQTLIDLYTIQKLQGKISGLNVALLGDLKHARVMRSLLYGLGMFGANTTLISPPVLKMDKKVIEETKAKFKASISETANTSLDGFDVLYVCRIQKERFTDQAEAERLQASFRLTESMLARAPTDLAIMHPMPKVDEVPPGIDSDPRAKYFEQAKNGVPVRMAVLHSCIMG